VPQTINAGDDVVLTVHAQDSQYHVNAAGLHDNPWPEPTASLFGGEDNWIAALTGTEYGPVTVRVQYLASAPPAVEVEHWDMIGERDLLQDPSGYPPTRWGRDVATIAEIYGDVVAVLAMQAGRYRVRLHVRNRQEAHQRNDPTTAIEQHLFQIWSAASAQPAQVLTDIDSYARARSATE
jgi:hypothetical protein